MLRGRIQRKLHPSELTETGTNRRVFIRGINVPAKLPPFQYGLTDSDLDMLTSNGFTAIRLIVTWESLEPEEGKYDTKHMTYIRDTVKQCAAHGLSVIVDPHQDVWSRCSGGDGAPEWTMTRLGFDVKNMKACCGSYDAKHDEYQMLWAVNYHLFACATMFTLFFGSERFAAHVTVDGKSAQQFLQGHFIGAFSLLATTLKDCMNVIGFGTLNEPSLGWIGHENIHSTGNAWSFGFKLTPHECIRLAMGETIKNVKFYEYPLSWPTYRTLNEHKAVLCSRIWQPEMKPNHFSLSTYEDAESTFLIPFWEKMAQAIHTSGGSDLLVFTETPPLEHPGQVVKTYKRPDYEVYAPHYYDPITLAFGNYKWWLSMDFATGLPGLLCCAQWARHNTINLITHRQGGVVLGETGTPWLGKQKSNDALEATLDAVESNMIPAVFLWCFAPNHQKDDGWNRENFSVFHEGKLRVESACRPYATRVAGKPIRMTYENNVFRLVFQSCIDIDSTETSIYLTGKKHSSIKFSDGEITGQANNILTYRHTPSLGNTTHWIFIEY